MTADGESLWRGGAVAAVRRDWLGASVLLAVAAHILAWLLARLLPAILAILGVEAATASWLIPLVPPPPPPQELAFVLVDADEDEALIKEADAESTVNREARQIVQPDPEDVPGRPKVESDSEILFTRMGTAPNSEPQAPSPPAVEAEPAEAPVDMTERRETPPPMEAIEPVTPAPPLERPEAPPAPPSEPSPVAVAPPVDPLPIFDDGNVEAPPATPPVSPQEPATEAPSPPPPPPEPAVPERPAAPATAGMPPPRSSGTSATMFGDDISMRLLQARWGQYMAVVAQRLEESLRRQEVLNPAPLRRGEVWLRFGIAADGSVVDLVVVHVPEGMSVERVICERTVREAGPFPPLTPEMRKDENFKRLTVRVFFL